MAIANRKRSQGRIHWRRHLALALGWVALAGLLWFVGASRDDYIGQAFRSRLFVRCGLYLVGGLALLVVLLGAMWSAGRRLVRRPLASDTRGTAVVEFALLFPIATSVVLVMAQAMLMMNAIVVVNYAAFAAARSAIVWVPKDLSADVPQGYDPEPENLVTQLPDSFKLQRVKTAAAVACVPISGLRASGGAGPDAQVVVSGMERYYGTMGSQSPTWVNTQVPGKLAYAWAHTRIGLEPPAGGGQKYDENAELTAWVEHDYNLSVPFAAALFAEASGGDGYYSTITARCTLTNEGVSETIQEDQFHTGLAP